MWRGARKKAYEHPRKLRFRHDGLQSCWGQREPRDLRCWTCTCTRSCSHSCLNVQVEMSFTFERRGTDPDGWIKVRSEIHISKIILSFRSYYSLFNRLQNRKHYLPFSNWSCHSTVVELHGFWSRELNELKRKQMISFSKQSIIDKILTLHIYFFRHRRKTPSCSWKCLSCCPA